MPSRFDTCLQFTLDQEGRTLEYDPDDPGGVTFAGIDQRDHPGIDVKHLTLDQAKEIYRKENWLRFRCDDLTPPWDLLIFDSSVNPGPGFPVKAMQECLSVKADGLIGPVTLGAVKANAPLPVGSNPAVRCFLAKRFKYYVALPLKLRRHFMKGWINRTNALASASGMGIKDVRSLA